LRSPYAVGGRLLRAFPYAQTSYSDPTGWTRVDQVGFEPTYLRIKSAAHNQALRLIQIPGERGRSVPGVLRTPSRTRTGDTQIKSLLF
jgi:hypothetical protein